MIYNGFTAKLLKKKKRQFVTQKNEIFSKYFLTETHKSVIERNS